MTVVTADTLLLLSLLMIVNISPQILSSQGPWRLLHESVGISAMHMQLLKNDKVVIFDRTDFGPSNLSLPGGRCRFDPDDTVLKTDCTAHSILYDIGTNAFTALTVQTDTWCSSGAVLPDGTLVQTGGFNDGDHVVRTLSPSCRQGSCDWVELPRALRQRRWYASNQILPDGRVIIVGGRQQFNYEYYPPPPPLQDGVGWLDFLRETRDDRYENNLYPFLHLLPDGNLFVFANKRSVALDHRRNRVVREFPAIPGDGPRNYPSSGSSVLLPLDENATIEPEIMICGGAARDAFQLASRGTFLRATSTCGRLKILTDRPSWEMEDMPMPRVMGDMVLLPDGGVLIINGAGSGSAGWDSARDPVTRPVIYNPDHENGSRFLVMDASPRPRLYHSTAILLTDGRVLVGGSNPHIYYNFTGVDYPTDLSLESFAPPYLAPQHDLLRPRITGGVDESLSYRSLFSLTFRASRRRYLRIGRVSVRIVAPSFNTHSSSMNQRMVVLKGAQVSCVGSDHYRVSAYAPSTPAIAPPGYYLLFVVHSGIPSSGKWVRIQ